MSAQLSSIHPPTAEPRIRALPVLYLVVNAGAGEVSERESLGEQLQQIFRAAGRECVLVEPPADELVPAFHRTARLAGDSGGVLVAVGGDGTIGSAAQAALAHQCPLGVIAHGTFNLFAREHGLPLEPAAAARAIVEAEPRPVSVGLVNQRAFLVNASVGFYPQLLEDREAMKARWGRRRWVALLAGLKTLLAWRRQLDLQVELDGETRHLRTPTLFVGNNRLQLDRIGIEPERLRALDEGALVALAPRLTGRWAKWRLLLRGLLGQLGDSDEVDTFALRSLAVGARRRRQIDVATDGEVVRMALPLRICVSPRPLLLMKPRAMDAG